MQGTFSIAATGGTPTGDALDAGGRRRPPQGRRSSVTSTARRRSKSSSKSPSKAKFLGLKKMTLNNMVQDPSMVHETLTYEAFRAAGVPAPRTGYADVESTAKSSAMHLNLETLDDLALERLFGSFEAPPSTSTRGRSASTSFPATRATSRSTRATRRPRRPGSADRRGRRGPPGVLGAAGAAPTWQRWRGCGRSRATSVTGTATRA